jgi:osmotically-inducible protein OsmY
LSSDIRRAIGLDQALKTTASQVLVSAQAGVVTLRGSVPDQQAHDSLISVVRNTPGVVRIVDETHITATGVSSPQYQTQTQSAPVFSSGGGSLAETGPTSDGGSAVGGQIFSMQVDTLTETDRTLAQRILQGLRTDSGVSDLLPRVNINVSEGRILLQGHVQNEEQKRTIEEAVRRAAGISNIENRLQVRQ